MNKNLSRPDVQEFVQENYKIPAAQIALKGSPFPEISSQELATQISGKAKAEKKLPSWFANDNILYPPNLNLEQTSSEVTANYKTSLVDGSSLADLTGGFGIDSFLFSKKFEKVFHVELNTELSKLAHHNFEGLGANNIKVINGNSLEFLQKTEEKFSWLYVDPSRRDNVGSKVFFLSDCAPNIPENLDFLFQKSDNILVKTSPLLDISAGASELKNIAEIHIIAVKNEVKELLWVLKKGGSKKQKVVCVNFLKSEKQLFEAFYEENFEKSINYTTPLAYLYEPNAAIMKSGLFGSLAEAFKMNKLHVNSHLFTSEDKIETFPGRIFKIEKVLPYKKKEISRGIDFKSAHITTRNFPLSVEALRKKLKLKDGGDFYLFFTTTATDEKIVLICRKTS